MKESMEERIGRYLSGEMSGHEREAFIQALESDPELKHQVEAFSRLWSQDIEFPQVAWNTEEAWKKFESNIPVQRPETKSVRRIWLIRAAAVAVLFLGLYTVFFSEGSPDYYAYAEGASNLIQLKDGTTVALNKGSEMKVYPFTSSGRHVELKGEAFFDVSTDKSKPFTILCGHTKTEVVGTSFNLKETATGASIYVASGKIIFSPVDNDTQAVALTAGEAAAYADDKMNMVANPSPNIQAWRTHELSFIKMPLSSVIEDISTYFDQKVIIENDAAKACIISIPLPFQKPQIKVVLEAVAASINASLVQDNGTYIIRGGRDCS